MWYRAYIPNFKAIRRYFEMGDFGGGFPPPQGGERGKFKKMKKDPPSIHTWRCVPSFIKIGQYVDPSSSFSQILEVVFTNFGQS